VYERWKDQKSAECSVLNAEWKILKLQIDGGFDSYCRIIKMPQHLMDFAAVWCVGDPSQWGKISHAFAKTT